MSVYIKNLLRQEFLWGFDEKIRRELEPAHRGFSANFFGRENPSSDYFFFINLLD
jgi:hypothetical protein